jgi:hypothetical protein
MKPLKQHLQCDAPGKCDRNERRQQRPSRLNLQAICSVSRRQTQHRQTDKPGDHRCAKRVLDTKV